MLEDTSLYFIKRNYLKLYKKVLSCIIQKDINYKQYQKVLVLDTFKKYQTYIQLESVGFISNLKTTV